MKNHKLIRNICLCFVIVLYAGMAMATLSISGTEYDKPLNYNTINYQIEECVGYNLTEENMNRLVDKFKELRRDYGDREYEYNGKKYDPPMKLEMDNNYNVTENTRYNIETLPKLHGVYKGIKVVAYEIDPEETDGSIDGSDSTGETTIDEQKAIDEWLTFLDGWWLGTYSSSNGTGTAKYVWKAMISTDRGNTLSIEKDTGALIVESEVWNIKIYRIDDDNIIIKSETEDNEYSRTEAPTEEEKKTIAVFQ